MEIISTIKLISIRTLRDLHDIDERAVSKQGQPQPRLTCNYKWALGETRGREGMAKECIQKIVLQVQVAVLLI